VGAGFALRVTLGLMFPDAPTEVDASRGRIKRFCVGVR
jgi:hypothetical protein